MKGAGLPGELIFSLQTDQLPGHPGTEGPPRHTLQALRKFDVGHANHESLVSTSSVVGSVVRLGGACKAAGQHLFSQLMPEILPFTLDRPSERP